MHVPFYIILLISVILFSCIGFLLIRPFIGKQPTKTMANNSKMLFVICLVLFCSVVCLILLIAALLTGVDSNTEKGVSRYFEKIRSNEALLTQFCAALPKGGNLHHHYSGEVYAETYWNILVSANGSIDTVSLAISAPGKSKGKRWVTCKQLTKSGRLEFYRQRILRIWSNKDYVASSSIPSDRQFFDAFKQFDYLPSAGMELCLEEIKKRAIAEHVQYIETMLSSIDTSFAIQNQLVIEDSLIALSNSNDSTRIQNILNNFYSSWQAHNYSKAAITFCNKLNRLHYKLQLDDSNYTMRYLTYTSRNESPLIVFRKLLLAFEAANNDSLINGVNIVSQEDAPIAMRDYNMHMEMFRFCHSRYPLVKYSMHAGELNTGLIPPEKLHNHIALAIFRARANRIGHGVDIAYEQNSQDVLSMMQKGNIPVEINLTSNEFILHIKNDAHPLQLYYTNNVPLVICTDDAGILRTSLTEQFVILAKRYPFVHYKDLKQFIRNSIQFSFIKNEALKTKLLEELNIAFEKFERDVLKHARGA